jgi:hypothetical protein
MSADRFADAVAAIDAANAEDPTGKEPRDAVLMTEWINELTPDASEALRLAARAHHVRRWTVPRSSYPDGRAGYLKWRRDLHEVHAREVERILSTVGYEPEVVARVQDIVRKRNLKTDAEVQAFEDALCLTFLQTQYDDLAARLDPERMDEVVAKTLAKMSERGRELAARLQ